MPDEKGKGDFSVKRTFGMGVFFKLMQSRFKTTEEGDKIVLQSDNETITTPGMSREEVYDKALSMVNDNVTLKE